MADKKITIRIQARDTASATIKGVGATARRVGPRIKRHLVSAFKAAAVAITGLTVAAAGFIKKIIAVGAETETARIRLDSIFGSVEAGAAAFEAVQKAAAQLPVTFSDTLEAASMMGVAVRRTGSDLEVRLKQLAEISARFGIPMREAAGQFQRLALSGAASADMFRERGVNAFLGIEAGARVSAEESLRLWDKAFEQIAKEGSSAVDRLASTWVGQVSMMQDALRELAQAISDTGLLTFATNIVKEVTAGVRLLAEAVRGGLGDTVAAAFGLLGAKAGMAFLEGMQSVRQALIEKVFGDELDAKILERLTGGIAIDAAINAASTATQYWTGRLHELAEAGREAEEAIKGAVSAATGGGGGVGGGGGGVRAPLPRGGLQPTIGGPGIPVLEALQSGALPTEIETRHVWRPVLELDTETVRREALDPLQETLGEVGADKMYGIGRNLISGLVNGMASMKEVLFKAALQVAAHFFPPLRIALGLFSPSKVTYGYGQNIVQGMILGMDSMGGALKASAVDLADSVTSALTLPDAAQPDPIQLQVLPPDIPALELPQVDPIQLQVLPPDATLLDSALSTVRGVADTLVDAFRLPQPGGLSGVVGQPATLTAKIQTDDTSAYPPWALDWLARANVELRFAGEP